MEKNQKCLEVGLVLAGAVSAGAYTAGVMDFLLEALEAWEKAKSDGDNMNVNGRDTRVPQHNLKIKVISGASAGGMTAAMTAVEIRKRSYGQQPNDKDDSLLKKAWVEMIDIKQLLNCDDLTGKDKKDNDTLLDDEDINEIADEVVKKSKGAISRDEAKSILKGGLMNDFISKVVSKIIKKKKKKTGVYSLLNSSIIDNIADKIIKIDHGKTWNQLPYITKELKIYLSLSNLRGIPYKFSLAGETGFPYEMNSHADYQYIEIHENTDLEDWKKLKEAAIATGAFPIGLSARIIKRSRREYEKRLKEDGLPISKLMKLGKEDSYDFVAVDGGLLNNEPIELAKSALYAHEDDALQQENMNKEILKYLSEEKRVRVELATLEGKIQTENTGVSEARNKKQVTNLGNEKKIIEDKLDYIKTKIEKLKKVQGEKFSNAIILVDPFPNINKDTTKPKLRDTELIHILGPVIGAMRSQCLFKPEELLISTSDDIYDRFLIAPIRHSKTGVNEKDNPLASGFFEGFGGFMSHDFRNHDYYLGRKNCQQFLKYYFAVPYESLKENEIFKDTLNEQLAFYPPGIDPPDRQSKNKMRYPLIPLVGELYTKDEPTPEWPTYSREEYNTFKKLLAARIAALFDRAVPAVRFTKLAWVLFTVLIAVIFGIHFYYYGSCGSLLPTCESNHTLKFALSIVEILVALAGAAILIFQIAVYVVKTWAKNKVVGLVESYLNVFKILIK